VQLPSTLQLAHDFDVSCNIIVEKRQ